MTLLIKWLELVGSKSDEDQGPTKRVLLGLGGSQPELGVPEHDDVPAMEGRQFLHRHPVLLLQGVLHRS